MRRWHSVAERRIMIRRWRQEIALHENDKYSFMACAPLPPDPDGDCHCYRGMGYFRKREPLDCGRARCGLCHWSKMWEPKRRAATKRKAIRSELE